MRAANEAKVGAVVVLALVVMVGGYMFLRGMTLGADLYNLRLVTAANITKGSDVRLQGVKVGQVQDVTLDPQTQRPLITLAVKRNSPPFKLLRSYSFTVRSDSLIAENYVDIRGRYNAATPVFTPGDESQVIIGKAVTPLADATEVVNSLGKDFEKTMSKLNVTLDRINYGVLSQNNQKELAAALASVSRLSKAVGQSFGPAGVRIGFGDPAAQRALNDALHNAALSAAEARLTIAEAHGAAANINGLTGRFNQLVDENRGQLGNLLGNLSKATHNVAGLTESLNLLVNDSSVRENSQVALQSLRRAAENIEAGTAGFKAIAADTTTQTQLKETLAALRITSEGLRDTVTVVKTVLTDPNNKTQLTAAFKVLSQSAASLSITTANLGDITTSLKGIVADPQLAGNIKASAENLNGTLAATRAAAERVNALLGGRRPRSSAATVPGGQEPAPGAVKPTEPVQRHSLLPTGVDFLGRHLSGVANPYYGDLTFNTEFLGAPFRLGISDIGQRNRLTIMGGRFVGRSAAVRYGLYRSKLGVGAEAHKGRFSLEGNLWNPNRHSANAYLGFNLTPNVEVLVGRENRAGVRSNAIGVRLRP